MVRFALLTLLLGAPAFAQPSPMHFARSSDEFVESIGVATHWGYPDTPYGFDYERVSRLLGESGVRYVRDGWHPRLPDLYARYGVRATIIVGPPLSPSEQIKAWRDQAHVVRAVEGPNEVDVFKQSAAYDGKVFPEGPRQFVQELHAALKADEKTRDIPILSTTVAHRGAADRLAPVRDFDFVALHPYAGGGMPENTLDGDFSNVQEATRMMGAGATAKPFAVTESGYHTATGVNVIAGVQPGVSERAVGKYIGRHFASYFDFGITHTDVYEFINEFPDEATNAEAAFGMVRRDGTPKPSYTAVKNLITLLGESKWNAAKQEWQRPKPFTPRALRFSLEGEARNVRSLLLQKSTGEHYLLLWQAVSVYDRDAKKDVENAPVKVTLNLQVPAYVSEFLPGQDDAFQSARLRRAKVPSQRGIELQVPDEVLALRINEVRSGPDDRRHPRRSVPTPQNLRAQVGDTNARLTWNAVRGADGYFVFRLNRLVGTVTTPEFSEDKLWPTLGHPYEVRAFDATGYVSPPAKVVAQLPNVLPDLMVTKVVSKPEKPRAGEAVTFGVTLKNIGKGRAIPNTTHGIGFYVNNEFIAWHDATNALAPGEEVTVYANSGPRGTNLWTATKGNFTVRALADDVNRISEEREDNNEVTRALTVE